MVLRRRVRRTSELETGVKDRENTTTTERQKRLVTIEELHRPAAPRLTEYVLFRLAVPLQHAVAGDNS